LFEDTPQFPSLLLLTMSHSIPVARQLTWTDNCHQLARL